MSRLALGLLTLLAALLRWQRIDAREAWLDEACSAWFAAAPDVAGVLERLAVDAHPPLHSLLLHGWIAVFGSGEIALRMPSLLAGAALVPVVAWLVAEARGSRGAGLCAATFAALSPWLLHYGTEARAYAGLALLGGLALAAALRLQRTGSTAALAGAAAATLAALFLHHYGVFVLPVLALAVALGPTDARRRGALALLGILALWGPWLLGAAGGQQASSAWLQAYWHGIGAALWQSAGVLAHHAPLPAHLGPLGQLTLAAPLAALVALWLGAPALLALAGLRDTDARQGRLLLLVALLGPTLGAALVSAWLRPIALPGRYDILAAPAFLGLWALGLDTAWNWLRARFDLDERAPSGATAAGILTTALACAALTAPLLALPPEPRPHRDVAAALAEAPADAPLVVVGLLRAPLALQLTLRGDGRALHSLPSGVAQHPGWTDAAERSADALQADVAGLRATLANEAEVWLAVPLDDAGMPLERAATAAAFALVRAVGLTPGPPRTFPGIGLVRCRRVATAAWIP